MKIYIEQIANVAFFSALNSKRGSSCKTFWPNEKKHFQFVYA